MCLKQISHSLKKEENNFFYIEVHIAKEVLRENWQPYIYVKKKCWKLMLSIKLKKLEKERKWSLWRDTKNLLRDIK